jgi:hypothetical protein
MHLWPTFESNENSLSSLLPWENELHPTMLSRIFLPLSQETWDFIFCMNKFMSCHFLPFGWCCHCQSYLSRFGCVGCLQGGCDDVSSNKKTLPWLSPNKCISSLCYWSFWLFAPIDDFRHKCTNMACSTKGSRGLPLATLHAFYRQRLSITLQKA